MKLKEIDALRAYARMMNTLDASHIEPLLDNNFRYSSQWMCGEIPSKQEFLDYMESILTPIRQSGGRAYAEIAIANAWGHNECAVTAEGEKENLVATVFAHVKNGKIIRYRHVRRSTSFCNSENRRVPIVMPARRDNQGGKSKKKVDSRKIFEVISRFRASGMNDISAMQQNF